MPWTPWTPWTGWTGLPGLDRGTLDLSSGPSVLSNTKPIKLWSGFPFPSFPWHGMVWPQTRPRPPFPGSASWSAILIFAYARSRALCLAWKELSVVAQLWMLDAGLDSSNAKLNGGNLWSCQYRHLAR